MFIHSVYFWLKNDIDDTKRDAFKESLLALKQIDVVEHLWLGRPVPSDRPVVDSSYDVALTVVFKEEAGHQVYQNHDLHQDFLGKFKDSWQKLLVYDFEE